jgi:uncharacterized membrane-anchored protein YhcB (DUF1043 family)
MLWLTAIVCLAAGAAIGFVLAGRTNTNPTRIAELEKSLQDLERTHARYKDAVSDHFNVTAELVQQMTDSYRDVYQHLASGAQDLCTGEVANKLLPASREGGFGASELSNDSADIQPPKDYAPRQAAGKSGALSEGFGLEKPRESDKDYL